MNKNKKPAFVDNAEKSLYNPSIGLSKRINIFFNKNSRIIKVGIFLFPLIFVLLSILLKWKYSYWYKRLLWQEDGITENLTALFYIFSCFISLKISVSFYKEKFKLSSLPYLALAIVFFFIGMEEISWGQRILDLPTPEYFAKFNKQDELTIHNLESFPIHALYIIVGLYGGLARFFVPSSIKRNYKSIVNYFTPNYYLSLYFLIVATLYLYYEYFSSILVLMLGDQFGWNNGHFMHGKDQEPAEFILSIGFFLFVLINYYRQRWNRENIF